MSNFQIKDGVTYSHIDLMPFFKLDTERKVKERIGELGIEFWPDSGRWWMAGEDIRHRIRNQSKTLAEHRESGTPGFGKPGKCDG